MATKRNTLCLADKMKVIEYAKQNNAGTRKIAKVFKFGRTQIQMILKIQELLTESVCAVHSTKTSITPFMIGTRGLDRDLCLSPDQCYKKKH